MVDALRECWRVLVGGGRLLDLRPLATDSAFEVFDGEESIVVGLVGGAPGLGSDIAAVQALAASIRAGDCVCERVHYFTFAYTWESLEELRAFLARHWQSRYRPPTEASLKEADSWLSVRSGARLRVRQILTLGSYRRRSH